VPNKCGAEATPKVRGKDDEGADMDMLWLRTLDFRDGRKSACQRDAKEQGVG